MLSTNLRSTQTLDPTTGVTRPVARPYATAVTTAAVCTETAASAFTNGSWSFIGRKPMAKVDLHPDRWPLQSTS